MCSPGGTLVYVHGEMQVSNAFRSIEHSNVEPSCVEPNSKVALSLVATAGGAELMNVSGGVVAPSMIVQVYSTGVASTFSDASVAKTRNVCEPRARPLYDFGGMQKVYGPPSSEHSHVVPSSLASKRKFASVLAGVASTKPCVSTPRTENVCQPTAKPVSWTGETQVE